MKLLSLSYYPAISLLTCAACQMSPADSHHADETKPSPATPSSAPLEHAASAASQPKASASTVPSSTTGRMAIGDPLLAKDVEMKNVDGQMTTIQKVMGSKGTLVVFTCNHCPYAKAWEGRITALGNEFLDKGIGTIAINSNDPAKHKDDSFQAMKDRAQKIGMKFPYVVDATSDVARSYGATKTPEVYLFDGEGKLVYQGAVDDNYRNAEEVEAHFLQDALQAVVAGEKIESSVTKVIGCSIKLRAKS